MPTKLPLNEGTRSRRGGVERGVMYHPRMRPFLLVPLIIATACVPEEFCGEYSMHSDYELRDTRTDEPVFTFDFDDGFERCGAPPPLDANEVLNAVAGDTVLDVDGVYGILPPQVGSIEAGGWLVFRPDHVWPDAMSGVQLTAHFWTGEVGEDTGPLAVGDQGTVDFGRAAMYWSPGDMVLASASSSTGTLAVLSESAEHSTTCHPVYEIEWSISWTGRAEYSARGTDLVRFHEMPGFCDE